MGVFEFVANNSAPRKKRVADFFIVNVFVAIIFFLIAILMSNWQFALGIAAAIFIVQYFKASRWENYFITKIKIGDSIDIFYRDREVNKHISDSKDKFVFKKKIAFNRTRTVYLAVFYKGELLLRQFESEDWKEEIFDTLIRQVSIRF